MNKQELNKGFPKNNNLNMKQTNKLKLDWPRKEKR